MKNLLIALSLLTLSLTGCTKIDPTEGTPAGLAARGTAADAHKKPEHTVAVKGTFATLFTPPSSPSGSPMVTGTGQVSHLGKSTFVDYPVLNFATLSGTGTRTLTAANGDQLVGTLSIVLVPLTATTFQVRVRFTVTGGTGRFTGASGYIDGTDVLDLNNPAGTLTVAGEITY